MTLATLDEIATWDEEGQIEGFQFGGRERSIQEWKEKKEAEEFEELCKRLYARKWAAEARRDERRSEQIRQALRRYREANREHCNRMERERRKAKYEADPVVNQCEECGEIWVVPYEQGGKKSCRFCSTKCRNRYHGRARAKRRNRGLRNMQVKPQVLRFIGQHPGCTSQEIATGIRHKLGSIRSLLTDWVREGSVQTDQGRPVRYSLPQTDEQR